MKWLQVGGLSSTLSVLMAAGTVVFTNTPLSSPLTHAALITHGVNTLVVVPTLLSQLVASLEGTVTGSENGMGDEGLHRGLGNGGARSSLLSGITMVCFTNFYFEINQLHTINVAVVVTTTTITTTNNNNNNNNNNNVLSPAILCHPVAL